MDKEHKDPNGEICKGKKEPQHPKCWHCDTCPYVECDEELQLLFGNMNQPKCICPEIERTKHFVHLTDCPNYQPPSENWKNLEKQVEMIGDNLLGVASGQSINMQRPLINGLKSIVEDLLSKIKSQLIKEYDKKYNALAEDKVRGEREALRDKIEKFENSDLVDKKEVWIKKSEILKLLEQNNE